MASGTRRRSSGGGGTAAAAAVAAAAPLLPVTPVAAIGEEVAAARRAFESGVTRPLAWRRAQLAAIKRLCAENKDAVRDALQADLRRPDLECQLTELMVVVAEVDHALAHLDSWTADESVPTPAVLLPGASYIHREPLGVVAIIAPWNFPIQLVLGPLVAVVAAGNAAVVKPSEVSVHCAVLLQRLLARYLDPAAVRVVQGGVAETTELLRQRFDYIMYTGNGDVARHVMAAAAKHLTPVMLELGGKSPTLVAADADLDLAAKRIVVGKCLNAGQVCLAPDYILAHRDVVDALTDRIAATARAFYGDDMAASASFGRIINGRHYARVVRLLETSKGTVAFGGGTDAATNYVGLTLIRDPALDAPVMTEEIFGPLLPILSVASMDDAIAFVNARPKPLALYVFTASTATARHVVAATSSGGAVINDVVVHNAVADLPFGGVGASGMGAYHGRAGFEAFSHRKAVFHQATLVDSGALRYPPYTAAQLRRLERIFAYMPTLPHVTGKDMLLLLLAVAVVVLSLKLAAATRHA